MSDINVLLPDDSVRSLPEGATAADLAQSIGSRLAKDALIAVVDGVETDPHHAARRRQKVAIVTPDSERGLHTLRHSTAHVLAQAVLELWPGATFAIGPPIADGFYYDFELPEKGTFSDDDLERIDAKMREIVKARQPFVRTEASPADALELMAAHPYKRAIIEAVSGAAATGALDDELAGEAGGDVISFYRNTDAFVDMCVGPHVPHTGHLGHFKLMKVAGAYWRGSEKNPMLQRIYGTAWASARPTSTSTCDRLEEAATARPPSPGHRPRLAERSPSRVGRRPGGLASRRVAIVRKLMEDYSRQTATPRAATSSCTRPHIANGKPVRSLSVTWASTSRRHVPAHGDGQRRVLPEAHELPGCTT